MAHETRTLIVETAIAAPFETVWRALREPAEIRRWHGWEYDGLDEEIDAIYVSGATASEEDGTIDLSDVGARFDLERHEERTLVRVTKAAPLDDGFDEIDEGWITFFNQLRFALERHPGEERRTLHFHDAAGPGPMTPARLGLDGAESAAPGERWKGTAAWGEPLAGEVFHRTPHQVGLSVEAWNDALLVLYRGGRVIVSTYGLDEARLADIRERLGGWYPGVSTNVGLVREVFERFNSGDPDVVTELLAEDFVAEIPPSLSAEPDVYEGHEGALRYLRAFDGMIEDVRFVPLELHDEGDKVIAEMVLTGRGVSSGIDVEMRSAVINWIEGGRIRRMQPFPDVESAREALERLD